MEKLEIDQSWFRACPGCKHVCFPVWNGTGYEYLCDQCGTRWVVRPTKHPNPYDPKERAMGWGQPQGPVETAEAATNVGIEAEPENLSEGQRELGLRDILTLVEGGVAPHRLVRLSQIVVEIPKAAMGLLFQIELLEQLVDDWMTASEALHQPDVSLPDRLSLRNEVASISERIIALVPECRRSDNILEALL